MRQPLFVFFLNGEICFVNTVTKSRSGRSEEFFYIIVFILAFKCLGYLLAYDFAVIGIDAGIDSLVGLACAFKTEIRDLETVTQSGVCQREIPRAVGDEAGVSRGG